MLFWTTIKVCLKSLLANKLRSILAMLGIIIGVGAVISMLALAGGARQMILGRIASMGSNLLLVRPHFQASRGVTYGARQRLTLEDTAAIRDLPGIAGVSPVASGSAQVKYQNNNYTVNIIGAAVTYFAIRNLELERGRFFTEGEDEALGHVAVIGPVTAQNLFGEDDPLNETIKIKGANFTVVGVTKAKGGSGPFTPDDQIIIPLTTGMKQVFGLIYPREINAQVGEGQDQVAVQDAVTTLLRKRHATRPDDPNDFMIMNQAEIIETVSQTSDYFRYLLGGVAAISLLVGGIGIMNIMLVTVTERTREIGVRKAIGAKERHIMMQFLIESVIISGLGGLIGVAAGVGMSALFTRFNPFPAIVTLPSVFLALSFAAMVGIVFGLYPAWRAAAMDPVEALRYE